MWIYLNDRFVKEEEAVVSVFDHGFLYGDGVYETIRSYGSRIFMRDQHLARLRRSAEGIGLTIPIPDDRMAGRSSTKRWRAITSAHEQQRRLSANYDLPRSRRHRS